MDKENAKDMTDMRNMKYTSHNGACDLLMVVDSMSVNKYIVDGLEFIITPNTLIIILIF